MTLNIPNLEHEFQKASAKQQYLYLEIFEIMMRIIFLNVLKIQEYSTTTMRVYIVLIWSYSNSTLTATVKVRYVCMYHVKFSAINSSNYIGYISSELHFGIDLLGNIFL